MVRLEIGTKSNETKPKDVILTMSINLAIPVRICLISCALLFIQSTLAIVDFLVNKKLSTHEGESTILKDIKGRDKKLVDKKLSTPEGESNTHHIPYYWKRCDELWHVITHTKWGASSPKVFVAASTQSKLTSESVAITLSSQLTTKMTNFVVFGCFWTPLKTEPKITKF